MTTNYFDLKKNYSFIIPIANLKINKRFFNVGDVKFYTYSEYRMKKQLSVLKNILNLNPNYKGKIDKQEKILNRNKQIYGENIGVTCAEVEVSGNFDDAYEKALEKVNTAINILKLYRFRNDEYHRNGFGIMGEVIPSGTRMILNHTTEKKGSKTTHERIGFLFPFELDESRIEYMNKNGFKIIFRLFKKHNLTDFEQRIFAAINWFGMSFNSITPYKKKSEKFTISDPLQKGRSRMLNFSETDRFLKCMIALEALLIFDRGPIRANLSRRIAHIIEIDYPHKKRTSEMVKKLYDLRCEIVHGGKIHITKRQMETLFEITKITILVLVKRRTRLKINNLTDFKNWLEKQDLS